MRREALSAGRRMPTLHRRALRRDNARLRPEPCLAEELERAALGNVDLPRRSQPISITNRPLAKLGDDPEAQQQVLHLSGHAFAHRRVSDLRLAGRKDRCPAVRGKQAVQETRELFVHQREYDVGYELVLRGRPTKTQILQPARQQIPVAAPDGRMTFGSKIGFGKRQRGRKLGKHDRRRRGFSAGPVGHRGRRDTEFRGQPACRPVLLREP
jgi:hypothetical protein